MGLPPPCPPHTGGGPGGIGSNSPPQRCRGPNSGCTNLRPGGLHGATRKCGVSTYYSCGTAVGYPRRVVIVSIGDLVLDISIVPEGPLQADDDSPATITIGGGGQAANFCAWTAA